MGRHPGKAEARPTLPKANASFVSQAVRVTLKAQVNDCEEMNHGESDRSQSLPGNLAVLAVLGM